MQTVAGFLSIDGARQDGYNICIGECIYSNQFVSEGERPPMFLQKSRNLFLLTLILCLLMSALCAFAEEGNPP